MNPLHTPAGQGAAAQAQTPGTNPELAALLQRAAGESGIHQGQDLAGLGGGGTHKFTFSDNFGDHKNLVLLTCTSFNLLIPTDR